MTNNRMQETHPADSELAAWVDEPESRATAVETHVESCSRCRERLADLARTRAALALDPPMPSEAAFAAQRERILEAIDAAPRAGGGRVVRRIAWLVPLAATIALIVLVGRTEGPDQPRTADAGADTAPDVEAAAATEPTLPIFADAREAAEDAAAVIAAVASTSEIAIVSSEPIDEDALDAALAAAEPLAPPLSIERSAAIESEFAQLPEEEQSAVLLDLASADFDL